MRSGNYRGLANLRYNLTIHQSNATAKPIRVDEKIPTGNAGGCKRLATKIV